MTRLECVPQLAFVLKNILITSRESREQQAAARVQQSILQGCDLPREKPLLRPDGALGSHTPAFIHTTANH